MPRKPRRVTYCRTCNLEVGVWDTPFANDRSPKAWTSVAKTAKHRNPAGRPCVGSLLSVAAETIRDVA